MRFTRLLTALVVLFCLTTPTAWAASSAGPQTNATDAAISGRDAPGTRGYLTATPRSLYAGDAIKFSGWLVRGKMNQRALLQINSHGAWRTLDRDSTNRRGQFVFKGFIREDRAPGTYRYRVLGKPSRTYGVPEVTTRPVRITVKTRPGSRELPWRPSQWFSVEDWRFALGTTTTDAWPVVHSQSQYADPPPPGWSYVAVPMTFTRTGAGSGNAWVENSLEFVGGNGLVYGGGEDINGEYVYCSLDDDWSDAPEVYAGASASASECVVVPTAAVAGGIWRLTGGYDDPQQFITLN